MSLPVTGFDVEQASKGDIFISKVLQYTQHGWPEKFSIALKSNCQHRDKLVIEGNCLMWGSRVVIPSKLRETVLQEVHQSHPGVTCMKAIARSHFWWPGLDKDLEKLARTCVSCQAVKQAPAHSPMAVCTYRLRWTISRKNVFLSQRCSFEVG